MNNTWTLSGHYPDIILMDIIRENKHIIRENALKFRFYPGKCVF